MIDPRDILKALFESFDMSARKDFLIFLDRNHGVGKWIISSDYCLHDSSKSNHVFAFSVLPYADYFDALKVKINAAIPKDIKKTNAVSIEAKQLLRDPSNFHFAFVLKAPPKVFSGPDNCKPIEVARQCIDQTIRMMADHGRSQDSIDVLRKLRRASAANGFNLKLLSDIFLLSHLYAFVTLVLARDNSASVIGWMSDRDKMTEAYEGVLWIVANENVRGLAEHFEITIPEGSPNIAVPSPPAPMGAGDINENCVLPTPPAKSIMWFDEFIRIPDYIAGVLSAWNFPDNELPLGQPKYLDLAEDVIATANNMAVMTIRYNHEFQAGRLVFGRIAGPFEQGSQEVEELLARR